MSDPPLSDKDFKKWIGSGLSLIAWNPAFVHLAIFYKMLDSVKIGKMNIAVVYFDLFHDPPSTKIKFDFEINRFLRNFYSGNLPMFNDQFFGSVQNGFVRLTDFLGPGCIPMTIWSVIFLTIVPFFCPVPIFSRSLVFW